MAKESLLNNLHGAIRLPLKALIAISILAAVLAFLCGTLWTIGFVGGWVWNNATAWEIVKWTAIIGGTYIALLWGGSYIEENW